MQDCFFVKVSQTQQGKRVAGYTSIALAASLEYRCCFIIVAAFVGYISEVLCFILCVESQACNVV